MATKLTEYSLQVARDAGFELAFAETTGAASTKILAKVGGKPLAVVDYGSWPGPAGDVPFRALPAQGHAGMSMMVVDLKK